jgi:hypothetical protein
MGPTFIVRSHTFVDDYQPSVPAIETMLNGSDFMVLLCHLKQDIIYLTDLYNFKLPLC